ncbi:hypothetical protein NPIL_525561, partial [Nephila pilipes]
VVALVTCKEEEECGFLKTKCKDGQYCCRPNVGLKIDLGFCLEYSKKGGICHDGHLCEPELECKVIFLRNTH